MVAGFTGILWEGIPAEINSNTLNAGPGPVPATVAGESWGEISATFTEVSAELQAASVKLLHNWQGIGADIAAAKMTEFAAWMADISVTSAADGAKSTAQAAINTTARLVMPTEAEITATRAVVKALDAASEVLCDGGFAAGAAGTLAVGAGIPVAIIAPIVGRGLQAAAEALEKEIDVRAAIVMEGYESASTLTATVPTIFPPTPMLANGLALSPLEQVQQLVDHGIAAVKGGITDAKKIKTHAKTARTQVTEANAREKQAKAEAEKFVGEAKKVIAAEQLVQQGVQSAVSTAENVIDVGKNIVGGAIDGTINLGKNAMDATGAAVKNVAGMQSNNFSLNKDSAFSNNSQNNLFNPNSNSSNLSASRSSGGLRMSTTSSIKGSLSNSSGSRLNMKNIGSSSLKGKTFNLSAFKSANKVKIDGEEKMKLSPILSSVSKENTTAGTSPTAATMGGAASKKSKKDKKIISEKASAYNGDLKTDEEFKLKGKVIPSVIGRKDK